MSRLFKGSGIHFHFVMLSVIAVCGSVPAADQERGTVTLKSMGGFDCIAYADLTDPADVQGLCQYKNIKECEKIFDDRKNDSRYSNAKYRSQLSDALISRICGRME